MNSKFVIVGPRRSGSTLLVRTLNSIEGICCHGEILNEPVVRGLEDGFDHFLATPEARAERAARLLETRNADPLGFIRNALDSGSTATGFKALYKTFLDPRWGEVTRFLLNDPGIRFIHLTRENHLRRYISEQVQKAGGPTHSDVGGRSTHKLSISVDIDDFIRCRDEVEQDRERVAARLPGERTLEVSYMDLAEDIKGTISEICRFLGGPVPEGDIVPALQKVGASDLSETVKNYDELLSDARTRDMVLLGG